MPDNTDTSLRFTRWVMELQSIAQCGLTYAKDPYDMERYQRLRELAAEMMCHQADMPLDKVKGLFCNETGYQTPKLDTRCAVFEGDKILLVHENSGLWSLPGGWVDVLDSVAEGAAREVREEAGLDVRVTRVVALQDRNRRNPPPYAYGICKVFLLCERLDGSFRENIETTETAYFAMDELPALAQEKTTREQIGLCFAAHNDPDWQTLCD